MSESIKERTRRLLAAVSDYKGAYEGAYNIREDGMCAGRRSTEHIQIDSMPDGKPGLVIHIKPEAQGETVSLPASPTAMWTTWCITTSM